jgi:hypothetical protein
VAAVGRADQVRPFTRIPGFGSVAATAEWLKSLVQTLNAVFRDIADMPFNRSSTATVSDTGAADAEFGVAHHLDRVPAGFLVTKSNKAAIVYKGSTAWTATTIYLKCSAANATVDLLIY